MSTFDMLRAHYATRSDDELKAIGNTPDLPEEAKRALAAELAHRNADPAIRRQIAITATIAALEQEKQDRLRKSRRTLQAGLAVALCCAAVMIYYAVRAVMPSKAGHSGLLLFAMGAAAIVVAALVAYRYKRARLERLHAQKTPTV